MHPRIMEGEICLQFPLPNSTIRQFLTEREEVRGWEEVRSIRLTSDHSDIAPEKMGHKTQPNSVAKGSSHLSLLI